MKVEECMGDECGGGQLDLEGKDKKLAKGSLKGLLLNFTIVLYCF